MCLPVMIGRGSCLVFILKINANNWEEKVVKVSRASPACSRLCGEEFVQGCVGAEESGSVSLLSCDWFLPCTAWLLPHPHIPTSVPGPQKGKQKKDRKSGIQNGYILQTRKEMFAKTLPTYLHSCFRNFATPTIPD